MTSQVSSIHPASGNAIPLFTAPSIKPSNAIACPRCDGWWTGLLSCHCGACHHSFTGIEAFDIHRRGGECTNPATILTKKGEHALIPANKPWPGWSRPGSWDGPQ